MSAHLVYQPLPCHFCVSWSPSSVHNLYIQHRHERLIGHKLLVDLFRKQPALCSQEGGDNGRKPRGPLCQLLAPLRCDRREGGGLDRGGSSSASPDVRKRACRRPSLPQPRHYLHWLCIKVNSPALTIIQLSHNMSAVSFIGEPGTHFSG